MVRVCFYNVANSSAEEASEEMRYAKRHAAVARTVLQAQADVVCLSELKACRSLEGESTMSAMDIALDIARRTELAPAFLFPQNLDDVCFWRCTLYNPRTLTHVRSFHKFAIRPVVGGRDDEQRGVMIMHSLFRTKDDKRALFWVVAVHFPVQRELKQRTVRYLVEHTANNCAKYTPKDNSKTASIVLGGDFNTFFDDPHDGDRILQALCRFRHASAHIPITYQSFPHHPPRQSALDHIFVSKHEYLRVESCQTHTEREFLLGEQLLPASDHYPLSVDLQFDLPAYPPLAPPQPTHAGGRVP